MIKITEKEQSIINHRLMKLSTGTLLDTYGDVKEDGNNLTFKERWNEKTSGAEGYAIRLAILKHIGVRTE